MFLCSFIQLVHVLQVLLHLHHAAAAAAAVAYGRTVSSNG